MGCGGSKIDSSKLTTPFLRRNIKGRGNTDTSANLSKKELLINEFHEEDHSLSHYHSVDETDNERRSMASPEGSVKPLAKVEEKKEDEADKLEEKKEEKAMLMKVEEEEEEANEGEERLSNGYICPSSPSFRVYCVDQSLDNVKEDNESNKDVNDECADQKLQAIDNREVAASVEFNEDQLKMKEKAKKGKRFRRVMGKGKPGAVKNMLKVKSCYYPSSSRRHNPRLLTQNSTA